MFIRRPPHLGAGSPLSRATRYPEARRAARLPNRRELVRPPPHQRIACKNRNKMMDAAVTVQQYSIGDLSREFDVTPRTIRFYEDRGLLAPQRRGQNRVYTPRDRTRLKLILRGKRLGFSITEIGEILDLYDAPDGEQSQLAFFVGKIRARKAALEDQARDLAAVLEELNEVEQRCTALMMPNEDA